MKEKEHLDAQEILEKYDRENQFRTSIGKCAWVVTLLGVSLTVFHLYTGYFGTLPSQKQGAIHLGTALGIIYLLFPAKKGMHKLQKKVPWYDVVLAFAAMYVTYHKIFFFDSILKSRITGYSTIDIIISIIGILLVLEATRRTVGVPIVVVASITILYAIFGKHIPTTILSHPGFSVDRIAPNLWYQESGVFGTPVQISAKFIFLFLFFGVMLVHTKIGQFFNDLAFSLTGRFTGGTAKTAVVASALQGMVSGSSVGNTVASGSWCPLFHDHAFSYDSGCSVLYRHFYWNPFRSEKIKDIWLAKIAASSIQRFNAKKRVYAFTGRYNDRYDSLGIYTAKSGASGDWSCIYRKPGQERHKAFHSENL